VENSDVRKEFLVSISWILCVFSLLSFAGYYQHTEKIESVALSSNISREAKGFLQSMVQKDAGPYLILMESIKLNLNIATESKSKLNLRNITGLNLGENRDALYLTHSIRSRIGYPLVLIYGQMLFGDHVFILLNFLIILFLSVGMVMLSRSKSILVIFTIILCFSSIPCYVFLIMPELLIYTLILIYFVLFQKVIHQKEKSKMTLALTTLLLVFVLTIKPVFLVLSFFLLFKLFSNQGVKLISLSHLAINFVFFLQWFYLARTRLSPIELFTLESPLRSLSSWISPAQVKGSVKSSNWYSERVDSVRIAQDSLLSPVREVSYSFQILNFSPILIALLVISILFFLKAFKDLGSLGMVSLGCILTQGYSGGVSGNWRYLNIALLYGILLVLLRVSIREGFYDEFKRRLRSGIHRKKV
jgi:hypothetical protein